MLQHIPFLLLSQQNIYNQRKNSSYHSHSHNDEIKLPKSKSAVLEKADRRNKGVSFFDLLIIREIHSDKNAQQALLKLSENYNALISQAKKEVDGKIEQICTQTEQVHDEAYQQLESLSSLGFVCNYPNEDFKNIDADYKAKCITLDKNSYDGYRYRYFTFPKYINGINLTSDAFKLANPYEKPLQEFLEKHPNNENNLKRAKEELNNLKKNKFSLLFNKAKREEVKQAQIECDKYQSIANTIAHLKQNVAFYENLTLEQKQTLTDYLEKVKTLKNLSKEASIYTFKQWLVYKENSMACPTEEINAYHSSVIKQAAEKLSKQDIIALAELEENASDKFQSLSDEQVVEIIKSSIGTLNGFEIDGKPVDTSILFEISDSCRARINELNASKEAEENKEIQNEAEM